MRKKTKDKLTPLTFEAVIPRASAREDEAAEALFEPVPSDSSASEHTATEFPAPEPEARQAAPLQPSAEPSEEELRPNNAAVQFKEAASKPVADAPAATTAPSVKKGEQGGSALPGWARWAYWIAVPSAVIWAGAMAAFASGYQNPFGPFEYRPYPAAAFGGLCLLPAVFILLAAYAVRQAAKVSAETRRARALADDLAIPAALAADQAGGAAEAVRREVDRATAAALAAERQLLDLRRALSEESDRLIEATSDAERRAGALTQGLARERFEMTSLTQSLDAQVQAVAEAITAQSRMVADASDLATAQLQEAEAALAARATDLATAAGEAGEAAELAGQALSDHAQRLESVGEAVAERISGLQDTFSDEHARLAALSNQLRADQQHIAAQIDAQRAQLLAASTDARSCAEDLKEASTQGAESLRELIAVVAEQVGQLAVTAEADQMAMSVQAQANLKLFTGVVAEERTALEAETRAALEALAAAAAETRKAALEQTEAARERVEELGQAAFAVGQKADQAFDQRIGAARRLIESSAELVEQAGQRSAERIEQGLSATHSALEDLQRLLGDIDAKVAALPEDARARAETVRQAVEQGIGELTAAARKAAEETQAIDAAFQGRIKHNYEVLSEALRLMGRVAGAATPPAAPSRPIRATPEPQPPVNAALPETERSIRVPPEALVQPSAPPLRGEAGPAESLGLRPRLKLTAEPAASMPARQPSPPLSAAEPEPVRARGDSNEWTWKDLLSSIEAPPLDDEVLAERLISEIEALGLDAPTLLPLARIDEIAAVMQAGDSAGARDVVRALAPSAIRRLSRRVLTDKVLRAHADRYLRRYEDLLADSAKRDRDGFITATLLGSDPGRAFLLFNAAVGELH